MSEDRDAASEGAYDPFHLEGRSSAEVVDGYAADMDEALRPYAVRAVDLLRAMAPLKGMTISDLQNGGRGAMAALRFLAEAPDPLTPTDIARLMQVTGARVTSVVTTLEGRGLVTREHSSQDRRQVEVAITAAGRAAVEEVNARMLTCMSGFLAELGEKDSADLVRLLTRSAQIMHAHLEQGRPSDLCGTPGEDVIA
ncbi:MAG: MarR family transcriptional regulator [Atopobiaceae bacterium]|jgi:DNA-binding MarR family transcriptional regulator|nr:MarR family transcriptional regulator [Atopobiaceae bacterium]MCH4180629.1 MarR family transcriptional regulator [Atopobiaceae bacterium]MCH4230607.1 MarR family transcriptional regulator [Atopobiaceae bacterium]MCH4277202.1 MarR family transcriptional regulator [Atopobiaceae bacterium]MCI1227135.1 MarR family transcriptional regulator [Atopobiaceae bacterium]